MKNKLIFIFLMIVPFYVANASGDAHAHGSIKDLVAPAVNVLILAVFLGIKLKEVMKKSFAEKSRKIKEIMERASVRSKEASALLEEQEKKIENLEGEIKRIFADNLEQVKTYKVAATKANEEKKEKLEIDSKSRLSAEKDGMLQEVQSSYLKQILQNVEKQIGSDKNLSQKVESRLLKEINL